MHNRQTVFELRKSIQLFKKQHLFLSEHVVNASLGSDIEEVRLKNILQAVTPAYNHILLAANISLIQI